MTTKTNKALLSKTNTKKVRNIITSFVKSYEKTNSPKGYKIVDRNAIARVYVFIKKHYQVSSFKQISPTDIKDLRQLLTDNQNKVFANQERLFSDIKKYSQNTEMDLIHTLSVNNNQIVVSSIDIAQQFGKRHDQVIRAIEEIECSPEFTQHNFVESFRMQNTGQGAKRKFKTYNITKDGFTFLVMGFTGKTAAQFKEAYINAFNQMLARINSKPKAIGVKSYYNGIFVNSYDIAKIFNKNHDDIIKEIEQYKKINKETKVLNLEKIQAKKYKDGYLLDINAVLLLDLGNGYNVQYQKLRMLEECGVNKQKRALDISKEVLPIIETLEEYVVCFAEKLAEIHDDKVKELREAPDTHKKQMQVTINLLQQLIGDSKRLRKGELVAKVNNTIEVLQVLDSNPTIVERTLDLLEQIKNPIGVIGGNAGSVRNRLKNFLSNFMSFKDYDTTKWPETSPDDY